jgi:hypothetical protein
MNKGTCKAIEALLDVLKNIFNVWSLFTLAWAGALGTLLQNPPKNYFLLIISAVGLLIFSFVWVSIIIEMLHLAIKLRNCREE